MSYLGTVFWFCVFVVWCLLSPVVRVAGRQRVVRGHSPDRRSAWVERTPGAFRDMTGQR